MHISVGMIMAMSTTRATGVFVLHDVLPSITDTRDKARRDRLTD